MILVIKRYANRKLYLTTQSRYISFAEIVQLLGTGADVLVIDNASKRDITIKTVTDAFSSVGDFTGLKTFLNKNTQVL